MEFLERMKKVGYVLLAILVPFGFIIKEARMALGALFSLFFFLATDGIFWRKKRDKGDDVA